MNHAFLAFLFSGSFLFSAGLASAADSQPAFTLDQLIALVPADAKLKNGSKWQPVGTTIATQSIRSKALKKRAEFTVKVSDVTAHPHDGHAIRVRSKPAPVTINGSSIPVVVYAYFDAESLAGLGTLRPGDTTTIFGTLNAAEVQTRESRLFFELVGARLKQTQPK